MDKDMAGSLFGKSEKRQFWEKRFDESNKEYLYFTCYRDLGPGNRNLQRAYTEYRKRKDPNYNGRSRYNQEFIRLAEVFEWERRANAYDVYCWDQGKVELTEKRIREALDKAWAGLDKGLTGYYVEEVTENIRDEVVTYKIKRRRWVQQSDRLIELVLKTLEPTFKDIQNEENETETADKLAHLFKEMVSATRKSA